MIMSCIPDLNLKVAGVVVLLDVDVDREMCVHVAHLVLVAFCDTNDNVLDNAAHCSDGCDGLAVAVVHLNLDNVWLWLSESYGDV